MEQKTFTLYVNTRGDRQVGIPSVDDEITITVQSGDPGGIDGEFEDFLAEALSEWYDEPGCVSRTMPEEWGPEVDYEFEEEGDRR
jgi:hypothetical protein